MLMIFLFDQGLGRLGLARRFATTSRTMETSIISVAAGVIAGLSRSRRPMNIKRHRPRCQLLV
jgi:hypothetical protein